MASSSEADLFLSPPPPSGHSDPAEEVHIIVAKAQQVRQVSPAIATFLSKPEQKILLLDIFMRQIHILKSRSQAFEDCHVTVFDKVLLMLTRNGTNLDNPAALQYYCEEFVGVDPLGSHDVASKVLADTVTAKGTLAQEACRIPSTRQSTSPNDVSGRVVPSTEKPSARLTSANMEPKLANMWNVYQQAKEDYLSVANEYNHRSAKAARFLRDTAENTIMYLKNKNTDPIMMAELEATYKMAKNTSVSLSGGRKRKFDNSEMDQVRGTPRGPSNMPNRTRYSKPQVIPFHNADRGSARQTSHPIPDFRTQSSGFSSNYLGDFSRPTKSAGRGGRGPSGIPYGYSREVDSYQPYQQYEPQQTYQRR